MADTPRCSHGHQHYCGHCGVVKVDGQVPPDLPECVHGNRHYCGHCGVVKGEGTQREMRPPNTP